MHIGIPREVRALEGRVALVPEACGQLVDAEGGQGEQLHQTNYAQHYDVQELKGVRGDYVESWNVYWISAHFLTAAAQLEEMAVDWTCLLYTSDAADE